MPEIQREDWNVLRLLKRVDPDEFWPTIEQNSPKDPIDWLADMADLGIFRLDGDWIKWTRKGIRIFESHSAKFTN